MSRLPLLGAPACPEISASRLNGLYRLAVRRPQPTGSRGFSWLPALLLAVLGCLGWAAPVRAEDVDVYLFAGQSNMWGTGTHLSDLPASLQGPRTGIWILNKPQQVPATGWYPLNNGVNNNWDGDSWGAEAQLTQLLASRPGANPLYVIKVSAGGSALEKQANAIDWNPGSTGELLDELLGDITLAVTTLKAQGKNPLFRGFIWMQGETECDSLTGAQEYQADFEALVRRVRSTAATPALPVYMGRVRRLLARPYVDIVRVQEALIAAADPYIYLFDTDDNPMQSDNIHFAPAGHLAIGNAIFALITGTANQQPTQIASGQSFSLRAASGPGTVVGTVALTQTGSPTPTFAVAGSAFEIDGFTGKVRVKDLSGITQSQLQLSVSALNGVAPSAQANVTLNFTADPPGIQGLFATLDPNSSGCSLVSGCYQEIFDATNTAEKYTAPAAAQRPSATTFPGTAVRAMSFDTTRVMTGVNGNTLLTPVVDEDLTIAAAINIPVHTLSTTAWIATLNKDATSIATGIGYDYAQNKFFAGYANGINGTNEILTSTLTITPGTSHVVRLRKVGNTVRLFIDGTLAGEVVGPTVRPAIFASGEGAAPVVLGGLFAPAPQFKGFLGKTYFVKGIPTTTEETQMDSDLAAWMGATVSPPPPPPPPSSWTLNVSSGSGSGSYTAGTVVPVSANAAPSGSQFACWTGSTSCLASTATAATTLTMPNAAASITATYIASPTPTGTGSSGVQGFFATIDPGYSPDYTLSSGLYQEIHDAIHTEQKYAAPSDAQRPTAVNFPGTSQLSLSFDGTRIMTGVNTNTLLTPGVDADLTIAAAVRIPVHSLTSTTAWIATLNKGDTVVGAGIGYNYAQNKFIAAYSNGANGTSEILTATQSITPGTSHVVRMRKAGNTIRLFIDGVLSGEVSGSSVRPAILASGENGLTVLGGLFAPAPQFTGYLGKIYFMKGIPTAADEARMDSDLASWSGAGSSTGTGSSGVQGFFATIDPGYSPDYTLSAGLYQEIHDAIHTEQKYTAPSDAQRPAAVNFPGTSQLSLSFDGTRIMTGVNTNTLLTAGVDADLTIAAAVRIPVHSLTSTTAWIATLNKGDTVVGAGIGYNYAQNKFIAAYSNGANGASEILTATQSTTPGTSHVVRMRKAGDTIRLFIDGVLSGEVSGASVRPAILASGENGLTVLGGLFAPAPQFTGYLGKIYFMKGIPTTADETQMESDLASWMGINPAIPPTQYLLTVNGGSGGGSYSAATVVPISAATAPSGQVFTGWTGATTTLANATAANTTVAMPAGPVSVTATYGPAPVPLTAYQQWKQTYFGNTTVADTAIPDKDGVPVLLKYATAMIPGSPSPAGPATLNSANNILTLQFQRLSPAPVSYTVEASTDLVQWSSIANLASGSDTWTGTAVVKETTAGSPRTTTITDVATMASGPHRFLRLRVGTGVPGTIPQGYTQITIKAGTTSTASIPLDDAPVARGAVQAVTTNTVTTVTTGAWGNVAAPYALRLVSGKAAGATFPITGVNGTTLTLNTSAVDLTQLVAAGDAYVVFPVDTLGTLFGTTSVAFKTSTSASTADNLQLRINGSWVTFFNNGSAWYSTSAPSVVQNNVLLPPDGGMLVIRRASTALVFTVLGRVHEVAPRQFAPVNSSFLANAHPLDVTLASTGFRSAYGWISSTNVKTADTLQVWSGGAWITFYHNGTKWLKTGSTTSMDTYVLPTGQAVFVTRLSAPPLAQAFIVQPLPYSP